MLADDVVLVIGSGHRRSCADICGDGVVVLEATSEPEKFDEMELQPGAEESGVAEEGSGRVARASSMGMGAGIGEGVTLSGSAAVGSSFGRSWAGGSDAGDVDPLRGKLGDVNGGGGASGGVILDYDYAMRPGATAWGGWCDEAGASFIRSSCRHMYKYVHVLCTRAFWYVGASGLPVLTRAESTRANTLVPSCGLVLYHII